MLRLTLLRLLGAVPVLFIVVLVTFFIVHVAPGGPFDSERVVSPQILENLNQRYHLNEPFFTQFFNYFGRVLTGDFGPSFKYPNRTVTEIIFSGLPITLELGCYAFCFAVFIGLPVGFIAAMRQNSYLDYIPMLFVTLGLCLPTFVIGPLLILWFCLDLNWLPVAGWGATSGDKILPTVTLGFAYAAYIARLTKVGMQEVLCLDYIKTAKAKGLSKFRIAIVHGLRNGVGPVISFSGPAVAGLLAGSFVVETIFQIPGLGRLYLQAAFNRDYTMVLGTTILLSCLVIVCNLIADLLLIWLNPKLRFETLAGGANKLGN